MSTRYYEFGPFQIDKLNHALLRDGKTIPLKPKVFDTLLLLVENRGRVVDKDEMLRRLWPETVVEESNLSQNVYLLRKALSEETQEEKYIETTPKRGYRFVARVTEVEEAIEERSLPPSGRPLLHKRPAVFVACFVLVFGISVVLYTWRTSRSNPTLPSAQVKSIAVLPFKPLAPDNADENLGFEMADTLITKLSSIRHLIVRQTSSVRKFTAPNVDVLAAGRELKVDAVVDASIHRVGNQIRITWRIVNVKDGTALSTGQVDRHSDDLFAVQDAVAADVAQALAPQLTGEEKNLLTKHYTESHDAYRLCMLGRYHLGRPEVEDWKKALEYLNAAVEKDPNYALAYAGLANAYISTVADRLLPKPEAIPKAKEAALKALRLDDTLSESHVASARIMTYYDWDWTGAEREFKRAIELNPNSAEAHREYAAYLTNVGRDEQALAEAKQARELDPLTQLTNFQMAWTLIGARRYDEAIAESQPLLKIFPEAHFWVGMAYLGKGMNAQAIEEFEKISSNPHTLARVSLGYAYGATGQSEQANKILTEFKQLYEQHQTSPYYLAMIYAGLGDKDQAFVWLEESYREHSRPLASGIKVNPMWESIHSDPRFTNLLGRMGLTQ